MPAAPLNPAELPLRDIHLPPAISWWPPAPGWWLLLLVFWLLIAAAYLVHRHRQQRRFRRLALSQLEELERHYAEQADTGKLLQGLSRLLRQAARLHFPQKDCAGLVGQPWLTFLDQSLNDKSFSKGAGQILANGPYQSQDLEIDAAELLSICRRWLQKLPPAPKSERRQK